MSHVFIEERQKGVNLYLKYGRSAENIELLAYTICSGLYVQSCAVRLPGAVWVSILSRSRYPESRGLNILLPPVGIPLHTVGLSKLYRLPSPFSVGKHVQCCSVNARSAVKSATLDLQDISIHQLGKLPFEFLLR